MAAAMTDLLVCPDTLAMAQDWTTVVMDQMQTTRYMPAKEPPRFGCFKKESSDDPIIPGMVKPTPHAQRLEVRRMPKPTIRFDMIPTAPLGIFNSAEARLLKPILWIKVVEYVPVRPDDMAAYIY